MTFEIQFEESSFPSQKFTAGENLSELLHACNSPILFGCRSGICGTCLIEVVEGYPSPANPEEVEALEVYAPENPRARLACQMVLSCPLKIKKLGK